MNTVNRKFNACIFDQLKHIGAVHVVQAWQRHAALLDSDESISWLDLAGGIDLKDVKTDVDLLLLADRAPNDLLFGLVYGKLADILAMSNQSILTPAHHVLVTRGARSGVLGHLFDVVLERGHRLELQAEEDSPEYFEGHVLAQSRSEAHTLIEQAAQAPNPFTLGQMTSWVLTNHRLRFPHLYTQMISDLSLSDIDRQSLANHCSPSRPVKLAECQH